MSHTLPYSSQDMQHACGRSPHLTTSSTTRLDQSDIQRSHSRSHHPTTSSTTSLDQSDVQHYNYIVSIC